MVTNMKLAFTNVPLRHNSACVIQKWLRFKRVITVRLAYISKIFRNGSKLIELFFKSCILVNLFKTRSYIAISKKIILNDTHMEELAHY